MEAGRQKTAEWRPCLGQLPALASLLAPPRPTPWIDQDWRPDGSIVVLVDQLQGDRREQQTRMRRDGPGDRDER
jgi:hypothetical protein